MKYRFVEHTADIAFEIYGKNIEELLRNATLAFRDAFIFSDKIISTAEREIELEESGESERELFEYALYDWLNELLYLFDAEHFAPLDAEVKAERRDEKLTVAGKLEGGKLKSEAVKVEPKAITLHKFRVEFQDGIRAFVVVDI